MAGPRSRGRSLQERAYASTTDAQPRSGGRSSASPSGSDAHGAQLASPPPPLLLAPIANAQRLTSPETEATSAARQPLANVQCHQAQQAQRHEQQQTQQTRQHAHQQVQNQQQSAHQSHQQHQPPQQQGNQHRSHAQSQQKAILPGVLASLVQAQRSFHPTKPARPPLGPSAPGRRTASGAAADAEQQPDSLHREGTATSQHHQHQQQGHEASHHRLISQRQTQHRHMAQQRRAQHPHSRGRPQLNLRIPVHDATHTKLHSFFTQRQRLLRALGRRPCHYRRPPAAGRPSGLLALPEDVLLKVVCSLQHHEIGYLFTVCRELRATMDTAMMLHFNVNTPHQEGPAGAAGPSHCQPLRPAKRGGASPAMSIGPAGSTDAEASQRAPTQPRALLFQDESECTLGGGTGGDIEGDYSTAPLTPISIAS